MLKVAGVRDGRPHDARHTAATVLLVLGVPERTVMGIMGWSARPWRPGIGTSPTRSGTLWRSRSAAFWADGGVAQDGN